jgi:hypothetical protein
VTGLLFSACCSSRKSPILQSALSLEYLALLLVLIGCYASAFAQEADVAPDAAGNANSARVRQTETQGFEQFVAYWTTEDSWHSELQLKNNQPGRDLTVLPALRTPDGAETALPAVTIKSQEVKSIDIGAIAPQLGATYGSVVLRYSSTGARGLYASVMVHDLGHAIAFHLDATGEDQDSDAASREGIWWLPNQTASDYLVLTNQGKSPMEVVLSLYDLTGKESKQRLALGPRQTIRYSVRQLLRSSGLAGTYGGIRIFATNHAGSLDSTHFVFDEQAGFSALLKMFDHDPKTTIERRDFAGTRVWTMRAPMLALSRPDAALGFPEGLVLEPQLFIRNTMGKPANATLRFNWRSPGATGTVAGPPILLAPFETRRIDVAILQDNGTVPKEANWASVVLTTKGLPDEVMAVAASYDATLRYGAQTPFSDQLSFKWEGSAWEYDVQHDSIITAGNGGTKPTRALFTIYYNQGAEKYELEQTLEPEQQMWIDVGKLIRDRMPDKTGKTLPTDLSSGSYEIRDLTDPGIGTLFEGKVTYDKTYGHVTYGCANCCAYHFPYFNFNPLGLFVGGQGINGVEANDTCGGIGDDISSYFWGNWTTANHSIATTSPNGNHTGMGVGATSSATHGVIASFAPRACPVIQQGPSGGDNVAKLSCSASVTRAGTATCTLSGPSGITASGWKFVDAGNHTVTRTQNPTSLSWSGVMVTSGVISVTATTSGVSTPLTSSTTVNNRTNFAFTAANPTQVIANSLTCYDGSVHSLQSPPANGTEEGHTCSDLAYVFSFTTISDNGPNQGYEYVTSAVASNGGLPTKVEYIVVSDLLSGSTFYNAQCGTYSSSNSSGFISGTQLKQNVLDHEQGSILSHWSQYRDAQNSTSNNIGVILEAATGTPGSTGGAFAQSVGDAALARIASAASAEPCGGIVNKDSSQSCATCGLINFSPYQTCSGQPVSYCH